MSNNTIPTVTKDEIINTFLEKECFQIPYNGTNDFYNEDKLRWMREAIEWVLTNPDLLRAQNLYTLDELNEAKREGAELGWDAACDSVMEHAGEIHHPYHNAVEKNKVKFLRTLPSHKVEVSKWISDRKPTKNDADGNILNH